MDPNETKHRRTKTVFKIVGALLALGGLALIVTGFVSMISSFGRGEFPKLFWCMIPGFPLLAFGLMLLMQGFRRELMQYSKNESVPVFNEAAKEAQPAFSSIAEAVRKDPAAVCPQCKAECAADAKFCEKCGAPLVKTCPQCGAQLSADAQFCKDCGKKL